MPRFVTSHPHDFTALSLFACGDLCAKAAVPALSEGKKRDKKPPFSARKPHFRVSPHTAQDGSKSPIPENLSAKGKNLRVGMPPVPKLGRLPDFRPPRGLPRAPPDHPARPNAEAISQARRLTRPLLPAGPPGGRRRSDAPPGAPSGRSRPGRVRARPGGICRLLCFRASAHRSQAAARPEGAKAARQKPCPSRGAGAKRTAEDRQAIGQAAAIPAPDRPASRPARGPGRRRIP